jgi:prophage antirepressor-like protein
MPLYNTITFEKNKIFIISDNENTIWFNAKQVCLSLKYKEPTKAISTNVEKEDKIQLKYMDINFKVKQQPDSIYINESGLYSLLLSSRTQKAKKFNRWVRDKVLPLIRQNNIFSTDNDITKLQKKINELEKKNKILLNDMKVEKFPDGAMVYVVEEYDENNELYYKLGKTDDMNKRIKIYNTHSIYNKKDYFKWSLNKIIKAFNKCFNKSRVFLGLKI